MTDHDPEEQVSKVSELEPAHGAEDPNAAESLLVPADPAGPTDAADPTATAALADAVDPIEPPRKAKKGRRARKGEKAGRSRRERRRFSLTRSVMASVLLAAMFAGGLRYGHLALPSSGYSGSQWFAPYIDVTVTPQFDFQEQSVNPNKLSILSFVVANPSQACQPVWGGVYNLDDAGTKLELDRRIVWLRQHGSDVIVSFGGAANTELSSACTDPAALVTAYQSVIDRYQISTVDFDVEGASLDNHDADARRAQAIATLQANAKAAGKKLDVWLTLPVSPRGLEDNGVAAVDAMLAAKVDLAGVNIMTMDFGSSRSPGVSMVNASMDAAAATNRQLVASYAKAGMTITESQAYERLGVTTMIGQNDASTDKLTLADTQQITSLTRGRGIRRLSMWSMNRDVQCGGNIDATTVNNNCSGVTQWPGQFSSIFGDGTTHETTGATNPPAVATTVLARGASPAGTDGAGVGPYSEWRLHREYQAGTKVVWNGQIYEAKWWNTGYQPDAPVKNEWDSPWRVVGPVLPSDHSDTIPTTTIPDGVYPAWNPTLVYNSGDRVEYKGVGYRAKWWTKGDDPSADLDNPWDNPWEMVGASDAETTTTTTAPTTTTTTPAGGQ